MQGIYVTARQLAGRNNTHLRLILRTIVAEGSSLIPAPTTVPPLHASEFSIFRVLAPRFAFAFDSSTCRKEKRAIVFVCSGVESSRYTGRVFVEIGFLERGAKVVILIRGQLKKYRD